MYILMRRTSFELMFHGWYIGYRNICMSVFVHCKNDAYKCNGIVFYDNTFIFNYFGSKERSYSYCPTS